MVKMENQKGMEQAMEILGDILPEETGEILVTLPEAGKATGKAGKVGKVGKATGKATGKADTGKAGTDKAGTDKELAETVKAITEEKEQAIKFIYGAGGQVWSSFPILLDKKENPFILDIINKGIQGNPNGQTLEAWAKANGTVHITAIKGGEWTFYMVTLHPVKQINYKPWELQWNMGGTSKLAYNSYKESATGKQVKPGEMVLTNITSNLGKAIHQAKALGKVFQMDYTPSKQAEKHYYKWDGKRETIQAYGNNSHLPIQGKVYKSLEEITGAKMATFQNWAGILGEIK
jgi:hypothetical protein